jgi:hypothetical protein
MTREIVGYAIVFVASAVSCGYVVDLVWKWAEECNLKRFLGMR